MKILITGATGFIGRRLYSSLVDAHEIWIIGRLPYFGRYLQHDFRSEIPEWAIRQLDGVEAIIHCGAEVHGVRSIANPELFVQSNIRGTFNLLEAARKLQPRKFIYLSSADVLGPAAPGISYDESAPLNPMTPYAAAKGAGEMLCNAWHKSWGVPTQIVRFMNVFGEGQRLGKFVPDTVKKMLAGETVILHVDPTGRSGSRHWIHVRELVKALQYCLLNGQAGETYHVAGPEKFNQEIIGTIGRTLQIPWREHAVVPGNTHGFRCSIQDTKLQGIYDTSRTIEQLQETVKWYKEHRCECF